jgi:tubulin--tyrosine ligase
MRNYYEAFEQNVFESLPITFHIKSFDSEFEKFQEYYIKQQTMLNEEGYKNGAKNIWIIKPGENTNRGDGIYVSRDLDQIKKYIKYSIEKEN